MKVGGSLTVKTLLLSFGRLVASLSAVLISVLLARNLSVEDFAFHKKAILAFSVVSPVLTLGLPHALYFFLPNEPNDARRILITNLVLLLLAGVLFAIGLNWLVGDLAATSLGDAELTEIWWLVGLYGLAMLPLKSLAATLVAQNRVPWMVRFQLAAQLGLVLSVGLAAWWFRSPFYTVGALTIWALIALCFAVWLMLKSTADASGQHGFAWSVGKAQLKYAVPLGLASMFGSISAQFDKLMVSAMCSVDEFAWYVIGAIELPLIGIVTGAMNAVILPELSKNYKKGDLGQIVGLWKTAMTKSSLVLIPCFGGVLLFAEDLVVLLYSKVYADGAGPLTIYAILLPLRCAVYGSVLMATNHTKWVTYTALLGLVVNVLLNALFIKVLGPVGAAWSTVISQYAVVCVMLPMIARVLMVRVRDLFDLAFLSRVSFCTLVVAGSTFCLRHWLGGEGAQSFILYALGYCLAGLGMYALVGLPNLFAIFRFLKKRS